MLMPVRLSHAIMLSSLYGHPSAKLDEGNDHIHEMYLSAIRTVPYLDVVTKRSDSDTASLVDEWRRLNETEEAAVKETGAGE